MIAELKQATAPRPITVTVADAIAATEVCAVLERRGMACAMSDGAALVEPSGTGVIAYAPATAPDGRTASALAGICARAAAAGRPVVMLVPREEAPRGQDERAAALALLRASGMIPCDDPDIWLETIVLLAAYGVPLGPRVAVVAPPGSLLLASATALEREAMGSRMPPIARDAARLGPSDVALVDRSVALDAPDRVGRTMVVPVVARGELAVDGDERAPLVGLRAAIGAALAAGRFAERVAAGLGPASEEEAEALGADRGRFERQLGKLGERAGDHETKVLLSSWGVPVSRQAVATTASAATRIAKKAGYPVEIKPWGPDVMSESDGCPVERDLGTAAEVRRAFAAVARLAELPEGTPVIVRATPRRGREVRARVIRLHELGWTVLVDVITAPSVIAAPAPLRRVDADELARALEATRADDPAPDHDALADILMRASHLAVSNDAVLELELGRILVHPRGEGAVVVDARATLTAR